MKVLFVFCGLFVLSFGQGGSFNPQYCPSPEIFDLCTYDVTKALCCRDFANADAASNLCLQCCQYDPNTCGPTPTPTPSPTPAVCGDANADAHMFKLKFRGASGQFELRSGCDKSNEKFSVKFSAIEEVDCSTKSKTNNKITSFTQPTWMTDLGDYQGYNAYRIHYSNNFYVGRGNGAPNVQLDFETVFFNNGSANLTYGNDTVVVPTYGLKFSFNITGWPFTASNGVCLDVGLMISHNSASTQRQSDQGNTVNVQLSDQVKLENPKQMLIDGNTAGNGVTVTSGSKKINYLLDPGMDRGNVYSYDPVFSGSFRQSRQPSAAHYHSRGVNVIIAFISALIAVFITL